MIKFGFVKKVEEKKDLFDHPYLVVGPMPTSEKIPTKFALSANVRDLLRLDLRDNKISWMYDENKDNCFYLINVGSHEAEPVIELTLALNFSSKILYKKMQKIIKFDETKSQYFKVEPVSDILEGFATVKLTYMNPNEEICNSQTILDDAEEAVNV